MVKVLSSKGGFVQIEMKGAAQAIAFLRKKGKDVFDGADVGTFRAATFILSEVQESIIGNRPGIAPKSVATGLFGNSITIDKIENAVYKVFPRRLKYPDTNITTDEVATLLEFGSRGRPPRPHFGNTIKHGPNKIKIKKEIK